MMIPTEDGGYVASEFVVQLRGKKRDDERTTELIGADGRVIAIARDDLETVAGKLCPIIPAAPGHVILMAGIDKDGFDLVDEIPVIAWRLELFCDPVPIGMQRTDDLSRKGNPCAVRGPDGKIRVQSERNFDTVVECINRGGKVYH
jgi:hypothetical protein